MQICIVSPCIKQSLSKDRDKSTESCINSEIFESRKSWSGTKWLKEKIKIHWSKHEKRDGTWNLGALLGALCVCGVGGRGRWHVGIPGREAGGTPFCVVTWQHVTLFPGDEINWHMKSGKMPNSQRLIVSWSLWSTYHEPNTILSTLYTSPQFNLPSDSMV